MAFGDTSKESQFSIITNKEASASGSPILTAHCVLLIVSFEILCVPVSSLLSICIQRGQLRSQCPPPDCSFLKRHHASSQGLMPPVCAVLLIWSQLPLPGRSSHTLLTQAEWLVFLPVSPS